jgi:hypothetical protein
MCPSYESFLFIGETLSATQGRQKEVENKIGGGEKQEETEA